MKSKKVLLLAVFVLMVLCIIPIIASGMRLPNDSIHSDIYEVVGTRPDNVTKWIHTADGTNVSQTISVTVTSQNISDLSNITSTNEGTVEIHPLMHFTKEQLIERHNRIKVSPKYSASSQNLPMGQNLPTGSKNLLSYLPYTPSGRNQGRCGDCWVWASTGALEIDHNVKTGISDRLSVQYLNSKYKNGQGDGTPGSWACCGGWLSDFTDWYNTDKTPIPWSNTNAGFGDANRVCANYTTAVPISSISTQSYYQLNSISYSTISTYGVGQTTAINNIKSALNSNKAVEYTFFYGDSGWNDFNNFWAYSAETSIFDPTSHNGETENGGHAVLIVGYDDSTDPNNPYWIVLNSWGAPSNRPNGLFRLKMNMNYDAYFFGNGQPYYQHVFEILDSNFAPAYNSQVVSTSINSTMIAGQSYTVSVTMKNTGTMSWSEGNQIRLGAVGDPNGFSAGRVVIPSGTNVAPNGQYTFTFNMTAPLSAGTYTLTYQMIWEGHQWFGEPVSTNVLIKSESVFFPPVANFIGKPLTGFAPLTVSFTDQSTNEPTSWVWYFGDEDWRVPSWTQVNASAGWSPRYVQSSVVMPDGSIVLMGGYDWDFKNDVWRSTNNGITWTQMNTSAGWSPRGYHSSVVMPDGSIVVMGGGTYSIWTNDTWRSTDKGATWTQMIAHAEWSARNAHSSVVMPDGSIVLMGGYDGNIKNDVWWSVDYGTTWTQVNASAGWSPRTGLSSVVMPDGSIVLTGGQDSNGQTNDTWRSTDKGVTWTKMSVNAGWLARSFAGLEVMPDGSIVLIGGTNAGNGPYYNDVWRSTNNGATWTQVTASAGWSGRAAHTSVLIPDGSIVLMGGSDYNYHPRNDVWRLQTAGSLAKNPSHTYTTPGLYSVSLQACNAGGYNSTRKTGYITVSNLLGHPERIGVFRNSTHLFYQDYNGNGMWNGASVDRQYTFGIAGDIPISGDWNSDFITEIGVFRSSTHLFYLDYNGNGVWNGAVTDKSYNFGISGDAPISGDWNSDGRTEIGVFRNSTHLFYLDYNGNGVWNGASVDRQYNFGISGDKPVTGKWS